MVFRIFSFFLEEEIILKKDNVTLFLTQVWEFQDPEIRANSFGRQL